MWPQKHPTPTPSCLSFYTVYCPIEHTHKKATYDDDDDYDNSNDNNEDNDEDDDDDDNDHGNTNEDNDDDNTWRDFFWWDFFRGGLLTDPDFWKMTSPQSEKGFQ